MDVFWTSDSDVPAYSPVAHLGREDQPGGHRGLIFFRICERGIETT